MTYDYKKFCFSVFEEWEIKNNKYLRSIPINTNTIHGNRLPVSNTVKKPSLFQTKFWMDCHNA